MSTQQHSEETVNHNIGASDRMHETWPQYLQRVTQGVDRKTIAHAADIDPSGVSRWITGTTARPKAEKVVAFARGLKLNPIEALVAAGYLNPTEVGGAVEVVRNLSDLSDSELMDEVAARLSRSDGVIVAYEPQRSDPWFTESGGEDAGVGRNEESG